MLDVKGRSGKETKEMQADNGTGGAPLGETVETGEPLNVLSRPAGTGPRPKKATHWFYSVPFAGVRYYRFDERTPDSESKGEDHAGTSGEVVPGGWQSRAATDNLAGPEQM